MKKYLNTLSWTSQVITHLVTIVILFGFMTGCLSNTSGIFDINHLREAQNAFNESAALENELHLANLDPFAASDMKGLVGNTIAIQNGYASALISIGKIYPSKKEQLARDNILGNVLFLKAMAQWRTGGFDDALDTAEAAINEAGEQLYPRDAAILTALPGLIKTDLAYKLIQKIPRIKEHFGDKVKLKEFLMTNGMIPENEINDNILNSESELNKKLIEKIRRRLVANEKDEDAVSDIEAARKKVHEKHEVNLYLIQAQLSAYRNYQVAYQYTHALSDPPSDDIAFIEAKKNLMELKKLMADLKKTEGASLVAYWRDLCRIQI